MFDTNILSIVARQEALVLISQEVSYLNWQDYMG